MNARKEYIRILTRSVNAFTPQPGDKLNATLVSELSEEGYLKGKGSPNEHGVIERAASWGTTVKGRLFLEELEGKEREASFRRRIWKYGLPLVTYMAGLASPIVSDALRLWFHLPVRH
jgi:hypothetical protein